jgi:flagellar biosynthesis regulator FlbT
LLSLLLWGDCVSTPPGKVQVTCHVSQDHAEKNERLIVDGAVIRNGGKASVLFIENVIPILREKDIMGEKEADTPCKRIYFILQLMYIDEPTSSSTGTLTGNWPRRLSARSRP